MGTVYVAEHIGLKQRRAIKFLREDLSTHAGAVKRFLQEAQVVSSLSHEHMIAVLDVGQSGGAVYYVMELFDGEDLRSVLRHERRLPWSRVRVMMLQICEALAAAHARGVVHRDLKPDNCFCVRRDDGADFVKLLDFGIAKVSKEAGETQLTATGETLGTVGYMAPEQAEGHSDPRSDIYALGVMMYEMLCGQPPYCGPAIEILAKKMRGTIPPRLRTIEPTIGPDVEALIDKAMHLDPEQRFTNVRSLAMAIAALPVDTLSVVSSSDKNCSRAPNEVTTIDVSRTTLLAAPALEPSHSESKTVVFDRRQVARKLVSAPAQSLGTASLLPRSILVLAMTGAISIGFGWMFLRAATPTSESKVVTVPSSIIDPSIVPEKKGPGVKTEPKTMPEVQATPESEAKADFSLGPENVSPETKSEPKAMTGPDVRVEALPAPEEKTMKGKKTVLSRLKLSGEMLQQRLQQRLSDCRPDLISETIKIRVKLDDKGTVKDLSLIDPARLRPEKVECVESKIKELPSRIPEVIDAAPNFELSLTLNSQ